MMNFLRSMRATPAGKLMKVRTIGSSRLKKAGAGAVLVEKVVRQFDLVLPDEDVLAVSLEEWATAPGTDRVRDQRADGVADGRGDHDDPKIPGSTRQGFDKRLVGHLKARERQDELGRQRHHRRLDRHR